MFVFRFESLLQLAQSQQNDARVALASALGALQQVQQQQQQVAAQRRQRLAAGGERLGVLELDRLLALARYERQLEREAGRLRAEEQACEAQVQRCQADLQAADIELRRFEQLQQRELASWRAVQANREQALLDELAARRHAARIGP